MCGRRWLLSGDDVGKAFYIATVPRLLWCIFAGVTVYLAHDGTFDDCGTFSERIGQLLIILCVERAPGRLKTPFGRCCLGLVSTLRDRCLHIGITN